MAVDTMQPSEVPPQSDMITEGESRVRYLCEPTSPTNALTLIRSTVMLLGVYQMKRRYTIDRSVCGDWKLRIGTISPATSQCLPHVDDIAILTEETRPFSLPSTTACDRPRSSSSPSAHSHKKRSRTSCSPV
jgi:hypothetical protein